MSWTLESGCLGKQTYLDKHSAKAMCRAVNSKNRNHRQPEAHIYACPGCGHYHVGRPIGARAGGN